MADRSVIEKAAEIIRRGGLVAFPTETVYGLGANALDPLAVAHIFEVKQRPSFDPLIVHIADFDDIHRLASVVSPWTEAVAAAFWPGPLTMVLPKKEIVPDIVTSGLDTVAIRMPSHPIARDLIVASGCPIAAPSANRFGRLSPTTAKHVEKQLTGVDLIIDGGDTTVGIESTVITFNEDGFVILRPGAITSDDLEKIVPLSGTKKKSAISVAAPGLLDSHYSPSKPLYIISVDDELPDDGRGAYLAFSSAPAAGNWICTEILSPDGDLAMAAVNMFGMLHKLEDSDAEYIIVEEVPEEGIGIAIMDRLRKAAFQYRK